MKKAKINDTQLIELVELILSYRDDMYKEASAQQILGFTLEYIIDYENDHNKEECLALSCTPLIAMLRREDAMLLFTALKEANSIEDEIKNNVIN